MTDLDVAPAAQAPPARPVTSRRPAKPRPLHAAITILIGAAVNLFSKSMDATWVVSQRAELQQDARATSNLITKDISLASAGMPPGGMALVSGAGTLSPAIRGRERFSGDRVGPQRPYQIPAYHS